MQQPSILGMVKPLYQYNEDKIESMPYFLYEISYYKIEKNMAGLLDFKYFKSDKLLNIKNKIECKRYKNYLIIRYINLIGAPIEFIKENNLQLYELKKKKK